MDYPAFLPQQSVLRGLFLHQDVIEKKYQALLPFINHPQGRLQTAGNGLQKRKRERVIHTFPILQQIEKEAGWALTAEGLSKPSRGRRADFAGPQAPGCETQTFCMPSKPALQAWSRGTQPPRGAGSYTK